MNYWHLQLHPSDSGKFNKDVLLRILKEKCVIGMGESWKIKNGDAPDPLYFKRDVKINDIVLIRDGSTPIAMVQVKDTWYIENNVNLNLDWFKLRRPIKILKEFTDKEIPLLNRILKRYDTSWIQASGTLTPCKYKNATNDFIREWYLHIQKEMIMENSKLTVSRVADIKRLWEDFRQSFSSQQINYFESEIERLQKDWKIYSEKLHAGILSIDEYTNRKGSETANMPGGYLCNFLERETRDIYGSSKPGNANNFEIKLNEDGATYTFRDELSASDRRVNHKSRDEAISKFNENIIPTISKIVKCSNPIEKAEAVENAPYAAKQILRKIAVLDNHNDFLNMYSDEVVDNLHNEFLDSQTNSNLGKNHEIRLVINDVLNLEISPLNSVLVSRFLWKYATSKGVADINTPNVILYGPPGTGKTHTVKKSLKFLCLGDTTRYEFITFHPSFTYEDFIDGIKPKGVTKDGNIKFELVDGVFKKFCKKAKAECELALTEKREAKPYYFVVDEINRANLSSVFGETLVCLERDYRYNAERPTENLYKTQYSALIESMVAEDENEDRAIQNLAFKYNDGNAYFGVPNNLFFIGIMNDVDKSIDAFDLALRRRFKWIRMDYDAEVLEQETKFRNGSDFNNIIDYTNACTLLNSYISETLGLGKSYEFGHSFFMKISGIANTKAISAKNMEVLFHLYLQPSLREYLRAIYSEQELDGKIYDALTLFKNSLN